MLQVGDMVRRKPATFGANASEDSGESKAKPVLTGKVIYVHPQGRFHVVEFVFGHRAVRECFPGGDSGQ